MKSFQLDRTQVNRAPFSLYRSLQYCIGLLLIGAVMFSSLTLKHTKAHLNSSIPMEASFRVTMNGFHVHHETKDNALETDGRFDEIRLMTNIYVINSKGEVVPQRSIKSSVMCDGTFRDPDGIRTFRLEGGRGFKAGDDFPTRSPWAIDPRGFNVLDLPPIPLFEGRLVKDSNAVVIIPSIWEMDGAQELRTIYSDQVSYLSLSLGQSVGEIIRGPRTTNPNAALREGATVRFGSMANSINIGAGFLGMGEPKDRPIGMVKRGDRYSFVPQVLILTFDAADAIARTFSTYGYGLVRVYYEDDPDLQGHYELYLQVQRVGN